MAFLVFALFWFHVDHAPLWVQALFVAFALVENDWAPYGWKRRGKL